MRRRQAAMQPKDVESARSPGNSFRPLGNGRNPQNAPLELSHSPTPLLSLNIDSAGGHRPFPDPPRKATPAKRGGAPPSPGIEWSTNPMANEANPPEYPSPDPGTASQKWRSFGRP